MTAQQNNRAHPLVISYLTLRKTVGILGISFPFVLALGAWLFEKDVVQESISRYYHTCMDDVFVGVLFAIGFFLFSYRGYEPKDNIAGDLACLFAIGVALLPTTPANPPVDLNPAIGILHLVSAGLLFSTLIYFSLFLFTKGKPGETPSKQKVKRNRVYRICGYAMALCILLIAVNGLFIKPALNHLNPVYWLEATALLAFGISWSVKGQAIFKDVAAKN